MDSSPIRYMYCEVHKEKLLKSRKGIKNPYSSENEFLPAFLCEECNRIYINATENGINYSTYTGKKMPKSQLPIFTTKNRVYSRHPGINETVKISGKCVDAKNHLIDDLFLPIRTYNKLVKANIFSYEDLFNKLRDGMDSMLKIPELTAVDISEIALAVKSINPEVEEAFRTNNIERSICCPVHTKRKLNSSQITFDFLAPQGGYSYLFYCPDCKRFYINSACGKAGTFKTSKRSLERGIELWVTDSPIVDSI